MLISDSREVASWPLERDGGADVSVVEALAQAQLTAKRFGWAVRVRDASPELAELLDFAGLELVVEVRR